MKIILVLFSFTLLCTISFADDEQIASELRVHNYSADLIKVNVYPIGTVFNGDQEYKLRCKWEFDEVDFIIGCSATDIEPSQTVNLNHDADNTVSGCVGSIGYGKYKIDIFRKVEGVYVFVDYVVVDYGHSNYPWDNSPLGLENDIGVFYYSATDIQYWGGQLPEDRTIRIWDQRLRVGNPLAYEPQNTLGFKTTNSESGLWLNFSQNAADYGASYHIDPGTCFVKFDVLNTHEGSLVCGKSFELKESLFFRLNGTGSTKFYVGNTDNNSSCNSLFTVNSNSAVILHAGSEFIVRNGSVLYMKNNTNVRFYAGSKMTIRQGGKLCVNGSVGFLGPGVLDVDGIMSKNCTEPINTSPFFEDSVTVKLDVL